MIVSIGGNTVSVFAVVVCCFMAYAAGVATMVLFLDVPLDPNDHD
jgi:hypothetical protein